MYLLKRSWAIVSWTNVKNGVCLNPAAKVTTKENIVAFDRPDSPPIRVESPCVSRGYEKLLRVVVRQRAPQFSQKDDGFL
jgi:hypothetical protein